MKKNEEKKDVEKTEVKEEVKVEKEVKPVASKSQNKDVGGKGLLVIAAVAIIVLVIAGLSFFKTAIQSKETSLSNELKKMGEEFYTDFYYGEISKNKSKSEVSEFLEKFKDVGIKVNLDNLARYDSGKNKDKVKEFKNEDGNSCNQTTTQAVIYPKSPYGKNDYKIEVELDCGFKNAKK